MRYNIRVYKERADYNILHLAKKKHTLIDIKKRWGNENMDGLDGANNKDNKNMDGSGRAK